MAVFNNDVCGGRGEAQSRAAAVNAKVAFGAGLGEAAPASAAVPAACGADERTHRAGSHACRRHAARKRGARRDVRVR